MRLRFGWERSVHVVPNGPVIDFHRARLDQSGDPANTRKVENTLHGIPIALTAVCHTDRTSVRGIGYVPRKDGPEFFQTTAGHNCCSGIATPVTVRTRTIVGAGSRIDWAHTQKNVARYQPRFRVADNTDVPRRISSSCKTGKTVRARFAAALMWSN